MPAWTELVPPLLAGMVVTLQLSAGGIVVAVLASLVGGLARVARPRALRAAAVAYVELFRGTSALVQLFWAYFVLPLLGLDLGALATGILVLGLNAGAYGTEVVRGALRAVPEGQREAARALGLDERRILWLVVFPQALPRILPPAGNVLVELIKNTSLASLITLAELTFQGQILRAENLRSVEVFSLLLVMYFALAWVVARGVRALEHRVGAYRRLETVR